MEIVLPQITSSVPAFLTKLWKMVDHTETSHLIEWGIEGTSFVIHNHSEFSASLLPYYYKHSNMASFVRQLNMYGFHKVVGVDSGGLKSERVEEMEFAHPSFLRGHEHLLDKIRRKVPSSKHYLQVGGGGGTSGFPPVLRDDRVNKVVVEVTQLKDKQEDMDGKLDTMRKENEALWREVVNLRQKHLSQQKIVNKLIHFLVSLVQPRMTTSGAVKRRYQTQLAIEDTGASRDGKEQKLDLLSSAINSINDVQDASTYNATDPMIGDVTNYVTSNTDATVDTKPSKIEQPTSPQSALLAMDPQLVTPPHFSLSLPTANRYSGSGGGGVNVTTVPPLRPTLHRELSREDMNNEVSAVQKGLDDLKDMLSGQITIDSSLISNLFSPEDTLPSALVGSGTGGMDVLSNLMSVDGTDATCAPKLPISMEPDRGNVEAVATADESILSPDNDLLLRSPTHPNNDEPNFFELSMDMDEVASALNTPLVIDTTEATSNVNPTIKMNLNVDSAKGDDLSLNTPVVIGDSLASPFLKSIVKTRKSK